jgi:hypothetical protein
LVISGIGFALLAVPIVLAALEPSYDATERSILLSQSALLVLFAVPICSLLATPESANGFAQEALQIGDPPPR